MHGFLFYSDHPDCTLLPQAQHIAAALPEYLLDGCMVPLQQLPGHISLNGACKAAALHPPCALTALQNALAENSPPKHRHFAPKTIRGTAVLADAFHVSFNMRKA